MAREYASADHYQQDSRLTWQTNEILEILHQVISTGVNARKRYIDCFWSKVEVLDKDKCWEWKAKRFKNNYGCFVLKSKRYLLAHRLSYLIHYGELPDGMLVCHKCDNPACVNPHHLFIGTAKDNAIDMVTKGRKSVPKGERCKKSKLTYQKVIEIRNMYASGMFLQKEIAQRFQVSSKQISVIVNRVQWKDSPQ